MALPFSWSLPVRLPRASAEASAVEDVVGDLEGGAERPPDRRGASRAAGSAGARRGWRRPRPKRRGCAPVFMACSRRIVAASQGRRRRSGPPPRDRASGRRPCRRGRRRGRGRATRSARTARIRIGRRVGQNLEREGLEGVAGEDRGRLVEGPVHGRPAPAQVVVVHGRQVVVDERVAVQQFERAPRRAADPDPPVRAGARSRRRGTAAGACRRRAPRGAWPPSGGPGGRSRRDGLRLIATSSRVASTDPATSARRVANGCAESRHDQRGFGRFDESRPDGTALPAAEAAPAGQDTGGRNGCGLGRAPGDGSSGRAAASVSYG